MDKRERIIESAIDVFRVHGIEKAKVSDIVKGADVAQGTFYLYFPSKLSVMPSIATVVVKSMLEGIKKETVGAKDISAQLSRVIDVVFQMVEQDREIFALMYAGLAATEYLQQWEEIYAPYYAWITEVLLEAQRKEEIQANIDCEAYAILLIGLIESAAETVFLYSPKEAIDAKQKKHVLLQFASQGLGVQTSQL